MISIVIPIYNVKQYIQQCFDSIIAQTYSDFEAILIDDGSTDGCDKICDLYCKKDARFKVFHQKNQGLVAAWKKGVELSKSDYIAFIDPDDWISEKYLEILVSGCPDDIVITKTAKALPDKNIIEKFLVEPKHYDRASIEKKVLPISLNAGGFQKRGVPMSRCGKIIKKNLILNNLKYCSDTTTFAEDVNIIFPIVLDATSITYINNPECIYYYRVNPNSMLHKYDPNVLNSITHVHSSLIQACFDKKVPQYKKQVYFDFLAASVQYYKNELLNPNGLKMTICRIKELTQTELFKKAIEVTNWHNYKALNRIIVWSMIKINIVPSYILVVILRELKLLQNKKLMKKSLRKI